MNRSHEETIEEFAKFLEAQLGVSLATQKLVRKGKNLLSENKAQKLSQLVSNNYFNVKIMPKFFFLFK